MNLDQLKAFLALAQEGRFTPAARRLGVSQPGLSRQLQALEKEMGARLLVRTPGGVVLTEAGERFLPHARRALDAMEAGVSELGHLASTPHGPVGLGTLHTVGAYLMPQLLPDFVRRHPDVQVRLREGMHDELEEQVARGELDLAILNLPLRRLDLVAQKLWQEDLILAVPKGHRLARLGRPVALGEAVGEPWVVIPGVAGTLALEAACAEAGQQPRIVLETDNAEAMRRMVEAGLGVALLPELIAREPAAFDVVRVSRGGASRQVAVVHRGEGYLTAAARALKSLIVTRLGAK
jgi:DNA-binding transcriptional LysR family regulator